MYIYNIYTCRGLRFRAGRVIFYAGGNAALLLSGSTQSPACLQLLLLGLYIRFILPMSIFFQRAGGGETTEERESARVYI